MNLKQLVKETIEKHGIAGLCSRLVNDKGEVIFHSVSIPHTHEMPNL